MVSVGSSYSSDLKVSGLRLSPCHCVVSLDKKLYPHCLALPKMGTSAILLGVPLRWTSIPSRGEEQYSQLLHATETGLSSCRWGLLGSCVT